MVGGGGGVVTGGGPVAGGTAFTGAGELAENPFSFLFWRLGSLLGS